MFFKKTKMARSNLKNKVIAYMQGGLGNQLFIYAAGYEQSIRLNCELVLDISFYSSQKILPSENVTPRDYELEKLQIPSKIIDRESPWFRKYPLSNKDFIKVKSQNPWIKRYCYNGTSFSPSFLRVRKGTTLLGYFQASDFLSNSKNHVIDLLSNYAKNRNNTEGNKIPAVNFHIRRGDYLDPSRYSTQVIASIAYFENAIDLLNSRLGKFNGFVFTDSPELVKDFISRHPNINLVSHQYANSLDLLVDLANGDGLVMSNSSLSWWAAQLQNHNHKDSIVIAPSPWHGGANLDELYEKNWLILDG